MAVKLYRGDTWTRAWQLTDASGNAIDLTGATTSLICSSSPTLFAVNKANFKSALGFIADTAYGITYLFVNSVELPLPATAPYPQNNAPGWLIPDIYMNE